MWSACCIFLAAGQPSDRLGEDVSESYKEFTERFASVEDLTKATMKKLIQGTSEHNKAMSAAKTDKEKSSVKTKKQNATTGLRTCNNILAMTKVLHAKAPSFIGDKSVSLSWKEATKTLASTTTGVKRPATGAGNNVGAKKGRVPSHQVVKKAFEGISYGGGRGSQRGHGRGQGRRGGGGGRSRGRGYWGNFLSVDKYPMTPSLEYFCLCFVYTYFGFLEAPQSSDTRRTN
ncbi:unnamed protein product [Brassica rapa subsp. trilocularis]